MSILTTKATVDRAIEEAKKQNRNAEGAKELQASRYFPSKDEKATLDTIIKNFSDGYNIQNRPRTEFNDLAWIDRSSIDQLMWNTYQPNDGDCPDDDPVNSWRSRAIRPITRNKVVSIASSMLVRNLFPKIFAYSWTNQEQQDAAQVMSDLVEWVGDQIDYPQLSLFAVLQACINPVSIVYSGFEESFRVVKRPKEDDQGNIVRDEKGDIVYESKIEIDEEMSGFKACCVPNEEFYISDFYQRDVQLQDWVIWRRVCNYELAYQKYSAKYENFQFVKPGVMTIYVDANQGYYEMYDANMQKNEVEEVYYWNRKKDQFLIVVNGILLTNHENPNPRNDKLYPFVSFFYEPFDEGRCFCGKSLVFKLAPDYRVINSLYPMIIDGTYLNIFPPTYATGSEVIGSDVVIPGVTTTFADPNARLETLMVGQNLIVGMQTMQQVERSIDQTAEAPLNAAAKGGQMTAYQYSQMEAEKAQNMQLFYVMISTYVKKLGRLMVGDIIQYLTIPEVQDIEGDNLAYKSFLLPEKMSGNEMKTRKVQFDVTIPDEPMSDKAMENSSFSVLDAEGGEDSDLEIYKVNPSLFRKMKYVLKVSPDTLNPMSQETERMLLLEMYKQGAGNPIFDQVALAKDFFLAAYDKSKRDPNKYIAKQVQGGTPTPGADTGQGATKSAILGGAGSPALPTATME